MNLGKYIHITSRHMRVDTTQTKDHSFDVSSGDHQDFYFHDEDGDIVAIAICRGDCGYHFSFFPQNSIKHPFALTVDIDPQGFAESKHHDNH